MRADLEIIASLIPARARVLDIGCGQGELLEHLTTTKQVIGHGLELSAEKVSRAVGRGLSVIQGDADQDLAHYPDNAYDYAILGETLQATQKPRQVLEELLRIAGKAVVSIPNFGHWRNRLYLSFKGRMPVTENLSYQWYETPNIHFCTIRDFIKLCDMINCETELRGYLDRNGKLKRFSGKSRIANLFAREGIFVLRK